MRTTIGNVLSVDMEEQIAGTRITVRYVDGDCVRVLVFKGAGLEDTDQDYVTVSQYVNDTAIDGK